ncbi:MAG: exo-alpha-sialidase [Clostridia bacterium]|nr:exo-alpha-sialidase [Clostridia bacterium]
MSNAKNIPADILVNQKQEKYSEGIRKFQGCPTIAVTKGGRLFAGWYSGGICEPHIENYNLIVYSDDKGKTWSEPIVIIPSNEEKMFQALDIQLWISPDGNLHVFWVQNDVTKANEKYCTDEYKGKRGFTTDDGHLCVGGYYFDDKVHACWNMVCENPDDNEIKFSKPRCIGTGFLRCKPLITRNKEWVLFNYDQTNENYGYSVSLDNGKTFERRYGAKKIETPFDETMAYQKDDGEIRMFARSTVGEIAESSTYDLINWTKAKKTGIISPNTRFYIQKLKSGRILLVNNDHSKIRTNMSIYLSEDDGKTFKYKYMLDDVGETSYPDVDVLYDEIFLVYDRGRCKEKEILFTKFTENDIINNNPISVSIISKP